MYRAQFICAVNVPMQKRAIGSDAHTPLAIATYTRLRLASAHFGGTDRIWQRIRISDGDPKTALLFGQAALYCKCRRAIADPSRGGSSLGSLVLPAATTKWPK